MSFASQVKEEILSHEFSEEQFSAFMLGYFVSNKDSIIKKKLLMHL